MPLIYVTGPTAAGKSTLRRELARRGYAAFEAEGPPFSMLVNRKTGEPATYPKTAVHRTETWLQDHALLMSRERVEQLGAEVRDKPAFLCGIPGNGHETIDLFEKIICLVIDKETMLHRVSSRTSNPFGKAPAELELILRHHEPTIAWYRTHGALMVDGGQPVSTVADEVLALAGCTAAPTGRSVITAQDTGQGGTARRDLAAPVFGNVNRARAR